MLSDVAKRRHWDQITIVVEETFISRETDKYYALCRDDSDFLPKIMSVLDWKTRQHLLQTLTRKKTEVLSRWPEI